MAMVSLDAHGGEVGQGGRGCRSNRRLSEGYEGHPTPQGCSIKRPNLKNPQSIHGGFYKKKTNPWAL